jgi:hypothetical protein
MPVCGDCMTILVQHPYSAIFITFFQFYQTFSNINHHLDTLKLFKIWFEFNINFMNKMLNFLPPLDPITIGHNIKMSLETCNFKIYFKKSLFI